MYAMHLKSARWAVIFDKVCGPNGVRTSLRNIGHAVPTELGPPCRRAHARFIGWSLASLAPIKLKYP